MKNIFCPICKSEKIGPYYQGPISIIICKSCNFVFHQNSTFNPNEEPSYIKFIEAGRKIVRPGDRKKYLDILNRIIKRVPKGGKICEIGARDGHFLDLCREFNYEVCAVELSPAMAGFLKAKGINTQNDYYKMDMFPAKSLDVIVMIQVLEHINDPINNALKIAHYHLRNKGLIVIEVPSKRNLNYFLRHFIKSASYFDKLFINDHCNYFTPRTLKEACKRSGFKVVNVSTGRLRIKYKGYKKIIGQLFDPFFELFKIGGILLIAKKE